MLLLELPIVLLCIVYRTELASSGLLGLGESWCECLLSCVGREIQYCIVGG